MDEHTVRSAITPLRMVFWGGLVCIVDITLSSETNGRGIRFDLVNDLPGALLIAIGVSRLARAPVGGSYAGEMTFVRAMAILAVPGALFAHFILPLPAPVQILILLISLALSAP